MPGMALRIAASLTVAPFSTSTVRVSPLWSTKLILAMCARADEKEKEGPQSYNGSVCGALGIGVAEVAARRPVGPRVFRRDQAGDQVLRSSASTAACASAAASPS